MIRRPVTRGDALTLLGGLVVLIAGFLPMRTVPEVFKGEISASLFQTLWVPVILGVWLPGLLVAISLIVETVRGELPKLGDWTWTQLRTAAAVVATWIALGSLLFGNIRNSGGFLLFIGTLLLLAGTLVAGLVPALARPLVPASTDRGASGPMQQFGGPQPGGQNGFGQPNAQAGPNGPNNSGGPAGWSQFEPFWFAVPVPTQVYDPNTSQLLPQPLLPGAWHLAIGTMEESLLVRVEDSYEVLLRDTSELHRA